MNLRQRKHETYVYSTSTTVQVPSGLFGTMKEHKVYVPSSTKTETIIEYLNPTSLKWEPLPTIHENTYIKPTVNKVELDD